MNSIKLCIFVGNIGFLLMNRIEIESRLDVLVALPRIRPAELLMRPLKEKSPNKPYSTRFFTLNTNLILICFFE